MGGGKSATAIALAEHDRAAQRVLVLCPKSVVGVWPHQFREHAAAAGRSGPARSSARAARCATRASRGAPSPSWTRSSTPRSPARAFAAVVNYEAAPRATCAACSRTPRGTRHPRRVAPHQGARRRAVAVRRARCASGPPPRRPRARADRHADAAQPAGHLRPVPRARPDDPRHLQRRVPRPLRRPQGQVRPRRRAPRST
jgi:hypothetical protein